MAEVEIVASAMACAVVGNPRKLYEAPPELRQKMPAIPPHLEQAILDGHQGYPGEKSNWGKFRIQSVTQLRQELLR